jgi:hypothetical protein
LAVRLAMSTLRLALFLHRLHFGSPSSFEAVFLAEALADRRPVRNTRARRPTPGLESMILTHGRRPTGCDNQPRFRYNRCGAAGFSITEVIVSVMVVSIGVIAFATAVGLASKEIKLGQRHTDIAMLVADQLEQLKTLPYDLVQSGQRDQGDYQLTWTVVGSNPKKVVLVVHYPGLDANPRADTLVTYVAP